MVGSDAMKRVQKEKKHDETKNNVYLQHRRKVFLFRDFCFSFRETFSHLIIFNLKNLMLLIAVKH